MRKHQNRKDESNDTDDKHSELKKLAVCNVPHNDPSSTMQSEGRALRKKEG